MAWALSPPDDVHEDSVADALKPTLPEGEAGPNGALPSITCPVELSIAADAWALSQIGSYANGKVITWSWMSGGVFAKNNMPHTVTSDQNTPFTAQMKLFL